MANRRDGSDSQRRGSDNTNNRRDEQQRGPSQRGQQRETWTDFLRATAESTDPTRNLYGADLGEQSTSRAPGGRKRERSGASQPDPRLPPPRPASPLRASLVERGGPSHSQRQTSGSEANPIDLTTPPRRIARTSHRRTSTSSIRLPRWQPDEEVDACNACRKPFSMLNRKHHCRKCGKVVCGACSQHRITIPRQFIVHPPIATSPNPSPQRPFSFGSYLTSPGQTGTDSGSGGGETVRVCNPCVPDPNYDPPPQALEWPRNALGWPQQPPGYNDAPPPLYGETALQYSVASRPRASTSGIYGHTNAADASLARRMFPRPAQSNEPVRDSALGQSAPVASNVSSRYHARRPDARNSEEDMCPICRKEFHPLDTARGSAAAREGHVQRCILRHESRARARLVPPQTAIQEGVAHQDAQAAAHSGSFTSRFIPNFGDFIPGRRPGPQPEPEPEREPEAQTPVIGILRYVAAPHDIANIEEKGGPPPECIICLEEFEVGQELSRLECFCKFHAKCLDDWWRTKGIRECPTHKSVWTQDTA